MIRRLALWLLMAAIPACGMLPIPARADVPDYAIPNGNWWRNTATLDMDFTNDRYYLNGTQYTAGGGNTGVQNFITGAGATFTRAGTNVTATAAPFYLASNQAFVSRAVTTATYTAYLAPFYLSGTQAFVSRASVTNNVTSTFAPFYTNASQAWVSRADGGVAKATYFDSSGTLQTATASTARSSTYSYNGTSWVANSGTLIEPAATNSIRNNTMSGAAAGTPGTAPTNWSIAPGVGLSGLTQQIVGVGTQNGISYIDIKFSGTTNATSFLNIQFDQIGIVAASNGQTWADSAYLAIVGGSTANITNLTLNTALYGSGNSYIGELLPTTSWIGASSTLTRYSATGTIANASVTSVLPYEQMRFNSGAAINITLRIGMPQLEQNAYATSVIATSSAAVTRAADVYNQQPASYVDGTGTLQFAAANVVRDTHNPASPYADLGNLIEPAATNSIRNNMMVGAVASTAIAAQTISGITDSSGTATVTTGSAHGLVAGNIVTVSGASPSNYNGTFTVASAPSTTTFTYAMVSDPGGNATTVGSYTAKTAGTAPTNWTINVAGVGGLAEWVVGTGTEAGINYVDIAFSGTTVSNGNFLVGFDGNSVIAAAQNQIWTNSAYLKVVSGSAPAGAVVAREYNNSGSFLAVDGPSQSSVATSGLLSAARQTYTPTLSQASTAYIRPTFEFSVGAGTSINFTLRIGMPQLEKSSYATSVIPTFGSAVTRSADVYSVPSGGTYFDNTGTLKTAPANTPRLDHSPTGNFWPLGVLIEESRTNLVATSIPTSGGSNASVVANASTAPDGTVTATQLVEDTSAGNRHFGGGTATITAGSASSYSIFLKAGTRTYAYFWAGKSGSPYTRGGILVNLSNGTFTNFDQGTPTSVTNRSVTALPNGWYRLNLTVTIDASSTDGYIETGPCTGSSGSSCYYTGDGASGIYLWGRQIEAGAFPTSYIPTYGSTVTRAADVFTLPTTASGVNGAWYSAGVGTLGATGILANNNTSVPPRFVSLDDGTGSNSIFFVSQVSQLIQTQITAGGVSQFTQTGGAITNGALNKMVVAFATNNANYAFNGTSGTLVTSLTVPTVTTLEIGSAFAGTRPLNGWLNRIWYAPIRHPDASLAQFTN